MTNLERVAYIRGLAEGLELDTDKKEVKVLDAMLTLLEDMALSISDLEEAYEDMADQIFYIYHFRLSRNELRSLEIVRALYCGCNTHS